MAEMRKIGLVLIYEMDVETVKNQPERLKKAQDELDKGRKIFEAIDRSSEEEQFWKDFLAKYDAWKQVNQNIVSLLGQGYEKRAEAHALSFGKSRENYLLCETTLNKFIALKTAQAEQFTGRALPRTALLRNLAFFGTIFGVALAILFEIWLFSERYLVLPLQYFSEYLSVAR